MRVRVIILGVIAVALAGALAVLRGTGRASSDPGVRPAQPAASPVPVTTATAQRAELVTRVGATGSLSAVREARLAARIPGRVSAVLVREGDRVAAGTALLRLDGAEIFAAERQAQAAVMAARAQLDLLRAGARAEERRQAANAVAQAQAGLDLAQAEVTRMRTLFSLGAVARQQLDAAETQLRVAQSAYDSARQQQALVAEGPRIEQLRASEAQLAGAEAALAAARVRVRDLTLTAPFAGTIVRRMVEPGESVSPGVPSFILAQLDAVNVELAVTERHRAAVRIGQQALVTVDALPGRQFTGRVAEISPAGSAASRSFVVKVRVRNEGGILQPGMFARGTIVTGTRAGVLQIPERAVLVTGTGDVVFVVDGGRAVRRPVTLGDRQDGAVEITAGLRPGDRVVVEGQEGLTDNQPVTPRGPQR